MSKRPQAEAGIGSVLNQLKAYRGANPTFQEDRDALISAEAEFGASDPMEGLSYKVARHRSPTSPKASAAKEKAASGMQGDSAPMAILIRSLHDAPFAGQPIQGKKVAKKSKK